MASLVEWKPSDVKRLWMTCARCNICKGSGHQSVPLLYAGSIRGDIMVIGQNPGEIKMLMRSRRTRASQTFHYADPMLLKEFYDWDVSTSYVARTLGTVFGTNWLGTGRFLYTNAVRCRTVGNAAVSDEMLSNCQFFTQALLEANKLYRRGIVFISRAALKQFGIDSIDALTPLSVTMPGGGTENFIYIRHYRFWSSSVAKTLEVVQAYTLWEKHLP